MEEKEPVVEITESIYAELVLLYGLGLDLVHTIILNLAKVWAFYNNRGVYESITFRMKEYLSTIDKCRRKKIPATLENIKQGIRDIAGIRIVTSTISDIYKIREAIVNQPGLEVLDEKDYVKDRKPSGYRSLHLIVSVQVYFRGATKSVPVEIQIRTKLMDHWSYIHHLRLYKGNPTEEEAEQFARWSDELHQQDLKAEELLGISP